MYYIALQIYLGLFTSLKIIPPPCQALAKAWDRIYFPVTNLHQLERDIFDEAHVVGNVALLVQDTKLVVREREVHERRDQDTLVDVLEHIVEHILSAAP